MLLRVKNKEPIINEAPQNQEELAASSNKPENDPVLSTPCMSDEEAMKQPANIVNEGTQSVAHKCQFTAPESFQSVLFWPKIDPKKQSSTRKNVQERSLALVTSRMCKEIKEKKEQIKKDEIARKEENKKNRLKLN